MKIDMLYAFCGEYAEVAIAYGKRRKYGLINRDGVFVVQPIYDAINYWCSDYVCVNIGQKEVREYFYLGEWGVVNLKGEMAIPLKYSHLESWDDGEHFTVCYQEHWGAINLKDEIVMPFRPMDYMGTPNRYGWLYVDAGGKKGYIDRSGNQVIKVIYDEIEQPAPYIVSHNPWFAVRLGDEWFYIDQNMKRVLF